MKRTIFLTAIAGAVFLASLGVKTNAYATTNMTRSKIVVNGKAVETPYKFIGGNPATTYMPIWYVQQVINQVLGISGTADKWDGSNWRLAVNGKSVAAFDVDAGKTGIYVNGVLVENAPTLTAVDPDSGQQTTFMPIWYVQQLVNHLLGLNTTTDHWDGTSWTLKISASTTNPSSDDETQQQMASAMWKVFDATTFDVHTPTSIAEAGVTPTSAPVTAGEVATWINDWATNAKGYTVPYDLSVYGKLLAKAGTWEPWSLQWESSADPYTWASENDLYQGTTVTGASSVLTTSDDAKVTDNLKWWLNGYKTVDGVVHLHVPFYGNYVEYVSQVLANGTSVSEYRETLADEAHYVDRVTATVTGSMLNLTLPDVMNSASRMVWAITARGFSYGGIAPDEVANSMGGKTLHIQVGKTVPAVSVDTKSLKANLTGYSLGFLVNVTDVTWNPIDGNNGQPK